MGSTNEIKKYLFISVKPEFANKIIEREKTIELRKVKPHVKNGDYVIIYASSPVKAVLGFGIIKEILEISPAEMWKNNSHLLGIDKARFDSYYYSRSRSVGIVIDNIRKVNPLILLKDLKSVDPAFHPPQIYRYVSNADICAIISEFMQKR